MAGQRPVAVLVMAYGTARDLADVPRYYTDIRGGRPPAPELVDELTARYRAIGGRSPLWEITQAQAAALDRELERRRPGGYRVFLGNKHSPPFIRDAVAQVRDAGLSQVVGLVLAPHYSALSIATYGQAVERALAEGPALAFDLIPSWHLEPAFVEALARRVEEALARLSGGPHAAPVIFTAHSLPRRILDQGDPYPEQLRQTAHAVADRLGLEEVHLAYQSAGRTPEPWLGPDVGEVLRQLAGMGHRQAVVCAQGFVADHLEVLYDLDVEAQALSRELGLTLVRARQMNADPDFVGALADAVLRRTEGRAS